MKNCRLFLLGFAGFLLFLSCSDPEAKTGRPGSSAGAFSVKNIPGTVKTPKPMVWEIGVPGGTWHDTYIEEPKSYNPFSNLDGTHQVVTGLMLDYLFDYDSETREWKGQLIDSFEIVVDETRNSMELLCRLRDNVFWSDGVQMTADDMVFWYDEIEGDPDIYPVGAQGQFVRMDDGTAKRILLEKIDKLTFKYIFPRVVQNPVLMVNASNVVPRHIWEPVKKQGKKQAMDFWGIDTPPEKLVGNGPFLLERNTPGERISLKKNPRYWMKDEKGNPLPYIDRIILTLTPDSNAELLKFQKGEIESYSLRGKDLATLLPDAASKGYTIWNGGPAEGYPALIFNQNPKALSREKHGWFNDVYFRRAVSALIDRETIINQTINGLAEPLYHIISEFNRYFDPSLTTPFAYNPANAKAILAEGGYKEKEGVLYDKDGNRVVFDIMTHSQDTVLHDYLNIIITDLGKAGIKANLQIVDFNVASQKLLNTYDWDCWLASFGFPTFPEQWYNVWRSDGNLHYWNPKQTSPQNEWEAKVDGLYQKLIYTYDEEKVRALYKEFQEILLGEMIILPIFRRYTFTAVYDRWGNVNWDVRHPIGDGYRRIYRKP
jgi:peptide/nickel transport system substrate-binding protein